MILFGAIKRGLEFVFRSGLGVSKSQNRKIDLEVAPGHSKTKIPEGVISRVVLLEIIEKMFLNLTTRWPKWKM